MKNLINFLTNYYAVFLFLLLELIGMSLVVSNNTYHNIRFMNWTADFSGGLYDFTNNFTEYLSLKQSNVQLAEENAALKRMMPKSYFSTENGFMPITDTNLTQQFQYQPAKVIYSTVHKRNNYAIINKGKANGIEPEMGVIINNQAVGVITEVSEHYATVMPILHASSRTSAQLKTQEFFGLITWNGYDADTAQLSDIPSHVDIAQGDTIITRQASGIYPEGMLVGTVASWKADPSTGFYNIQVDLACDFRKLHHVYVVKNAFQEELIELQEKEEELP